MTDLPTLKRRLESAVDRCCPASVRAERDDIVQEAMLKANRALDEGRSVNQAWLSRVAYTTMVDAIRRRGVVAQAAVEPVSAQPDPERQTHMSRLAAGLRTCMGHLMDARRRAVLLFLNGHTAREVGRLLGVEHKSAENLIFRGRQELRDCLSRAGITAVSVR